MTGSDEVSDRRIQTLSLAILGLVGLGFLLSYTRSFTIPFAVAALFAVLLSPIVEAMERRLPTAAALGLLAALLFAALGGLGALIFEAVRSVADAAPRYSERARAVADWVVRRLDGVLDVSAVEGGASVGLEERLARLLSSETFLNQVNQGIGNFVSFLSSLLVMLLFLTFFLAGRKRFEGKVAVLLAQGEGQDRARGLIQRVSGRIQAYLVVKTVISMGTGALFGLVAWAFGLDFPLVWAFLAFVLNYIPSIGPLFAVLPPILLAVFQFEAFGRTVGLAATLLSLNFVSGNVVEPQLMGRRLDLNVVVVLLSLFAWGSVWGFVGMLLAVPLTSILNILVSHSTRFGWLSELLSDGDPRAPAGG